ncbi:MAG: 3'-5' exonuclease [Chloroflexota bacterium]|nr:3'-5' exonuclease [Chloroflexota bacterium]
MVLRRATGGSLRRPPVQSPPSTLARAATSDPSWEAVAWAYRLATDAATLYLDTETTGLDGGAEVVDLAVVGADGRVLLETLVRPSGAIPSGATTIHGIRDHHVAGAPPWPDVHEHLRMLIRGRPVVVYNAAFDRRIVEQCCSRHGVEPPEARWECAMRNYAAFFGQPGARGGFRNHKLEHAVARFGGAPGGHRAAADALACRAVVLGMAALAVADGDGEVGPEFD